MSDSEEVTQLRARVAVLERALSETTDAAAACLRVITLLGETAIGMVENELQQAGVQEGFGPRASAVLDKEQAMTDDACRSRSCFQGLMPERAGCPAFTQAVGKRPIRSRPRVAAGEA